MSNANKTIRGGAVHEIQDLKAQIEVLKETIRVQALEFNKAKTAIECMSQSKFLARESLRSAKGNASNALANNKGAGDAALHLMVGIDHALNHLS